MLLYDPMRGLVEYASDSQMGKEADDTQRDDIGILEGKFKHKKHSGNGSSQDGGKKS